MTRCVQLLGSVVFAGAVCMTLAMPMRGQEGARQFGGDIVSGYSGTSVNGIGVQEPYIGLLGRLNGYWKDRRILTYNVEPNFVHGFQWDGLLIGPQSNGITANTDFLGGSDFPLFVYFSRQNIPSPDYGPGSGLNWQGSSRTEGRFGADWVLRFQRLPKITLGYQRDDDQSNYPQGAGAGDVNSLSQSFRTGVSYEIAKWSLSGAFNRTFVQVHLPRILTQDWNSDAQYETDKSRTGNYNVTLQRMLPWQSRFSVSAGKTDSNLNLDGEKTDIGYEHLDANFYTQPTRRLATTLTTSYVDNASDVARQELLSGSQDPNLLATLLSQRSAMLTATAGASYFITQSLTVNGDYSSGHPLKNTGTLIGQGLGDTEGFGGSINYRHKLFGGFTSVGYNRHHSTTDLQPVDVNTVNQSVFASYTRDLPWSLKLIATGDVMHQNLEFSYKDNVNSWGLNFDVRRKIGDQWSLETRFILRKQSHEWPSRLETDSNTIAFNLISKRLQFSGAEVYATGLAYQFGNSIVVVPGAEPSVNVPGLPSLILSTSNTMYFTGMFRPTRRSSVRGLWRRTSGGVIGNIGVGQQGFDFRAEYMFRQLNLGAGFARDWEEKTANVLIPLTAQRFYFEVKRSFRLF